MDTSPQYGAVFFPTLYRSSSRPATSNAVYLHTQSTPTKSSGRTAACAGSSSGQTSVSSVTRAGLDDDDDDDEVRMINRHQEFFEADSGLVPDLLAADCQDHDFGGPAWRLIIATTKVECLNRFDELCSVLAGNKSYAFTDCKTVYIKPLSQLRFDYNTTRIRRYYDAFDYDGSDRNYDLRSIRLRYDYDTTTSNCVE